MTVKELIGLLSKEDPDCLVVLSIDEEGNGYNPVRSAVPMMYDERNRQIGYERLTNAMRTQGYSEEDILKDGKKAVILWP